MCVVIKYTLLLLLSSSRSWYKYSEELETVRALWIVVAIKYLFCLTNPFQLQLIVKNDMCIRYVDVATCHFFRRHFLKKKNREEEKGRKKEKKKKEEKDAFLKEIILQFVLPSFLYLFGYSEKKNSNKIKI